METMKLKINAQKKKKKKNKSILLFLTKYNEMFDKGIDKIYLVKLFISLLYEVCMKLYR